MKVGSMILGMLLLAIFNLGLLAESIRPPGERSVHATGATAIPAPTLKLTKAKSHSNGSIEFQVDSTERFKVMIESSTNLTNWTFQAFGEPHAAVVFTNHSERGAHRFYRAADYTLRIQGTVRDIQTDMPVGQAKVTVTHFSGIPGDIVTQTDADGVFRAIVSREHPIRRITVEKAGYDLLTTEPLIYSDASSFQVPLWLAPPGYRPPNDDFQNRFVIEGTNVAIRARTFAATSEPGHALDIWFYDYIQSYPRNLWWTWTAPKDAAVQIEMERAPVVGGSGAIVYTGASLQELVFVWDTGMTFRPDFFSDVFLVKQGVQYHIAFGTVWPADAGFTFRMVAPVPPVVHASIGAEGTPIKAVGENLSLYVSAKGVWPFRYQWRKDGLDIPNSTNASFYKGSLQLQDAGAYSVRVANEAGTTISDEIHIVVLEKRPTAQELLQGTWTQETSQGPLLVTFADGEFTAKRASDHSSAGSGHYTISATGTPDRYRLVMTYTEPLPEVVRYFWVALFSLDTGTYQEMDSDWNVSPHYEIGAFTRLSQP